MTYTSNPAIYSFRPLIELERLLSNAARSQSIPKVNILSTENTTEIRLAIPGISKGDIEINFENNILKIESKKKIEEKTENKAAYLIKEFDYSNFKTEYKISAKVDINNLSAKMVDGILSINLPVKNEERISNNKNIEIN
jgi:HSP20 family protein